MNYKKYLLITLCLTNCQMQAFDIVDVVIATYLYLATSNPDTSQIAADQKILNYSHQVHNTIQWSWKLDDCQITYKCFKTKDAEIKTEHVAHGSSFTADNQKYIVISHLQNTEKIYETRITLFGYKQIVINSHEALAIMNDTAYLTFTDYEIIGSLFNSRRKSSLLEYDWMYKTGIVLNGSSFTARGIHYFVQNC